MNLNNRIFPVVMMLAMAVAQAQAAAPNGKPAPKALPPPPPPPAIDFAAVDKDLDGRLSKEECALVADLAGAFATLDVDGDTFIAPSEFSKWARAGKSEPAPRPDPAAAPSGSAGAQHMSGK